MIGGKLDPAQIARLASLPIKARVIVEGALSGMHRANIHGASVEFAEHKEYSPGDELRHVDWKVYGKQDRYYVKQFEHESQLTVYLVLDASASMAFAGGAAMPKLEYGALALAAIAYLAIQQQDKVGLYACGAKGKDLVVPARARTTHLHDLLGVLDGVVTAGARGPECNESIGAALARIAELSRRRRSLVVVASDLFDADDRVIGILGQLRAQRHDVTVIHTIDPHELAFPYDGLTQFEALESDHKLLVNPSAIKKDYLARMQAFLARAKTELADAGVDYHLAVTDRPFDDMLLEVLVARSRLAAFRPARSAV